MDKGGIKLAARTEDKHWELMFAIFVCPKNSELVRSRVGDYDEANHNCWIVFAADNARRIHVVTDKDFNENFTIVK